MPVSLKEQTAWKREKAANLTDRVEAAIDRAVTAVLYEAANTPSHAQRIAWASNLDQTQGQSRRLAEGVIERMLTVEPFISGIANTTDTEIINYVNGRINFWAGVA